MPFNDFFYLTSVGISLGVMLLALIFISHRCYVKIINFIRRYRNNDKSEHSRLW
jgi:hypothetical protein